MAEYPEPVTGAVIYSGDKIFLMQSPKWDNQWLIPGGHVEKGETVEQCVKREVKEETGLNVSDLELITVSTGAPDSFEREAEFIYLNYRCKAENTDVELDNREATDYTWIRPEKALEKLDLNDSTRELLEQVNSA